MQALSTWKPPTGTLGLIVDEARARASLLRDAAVEARLRDAANASARPASLAAVLQGRTVAVIAEIKRRSPSRGEIRPDLSVVGQARAYAAGGAVALSVLTEPRHFGGSVSDLVDVSGAVRLPLLKKDFHVEPIQLVEARAIGASAALLIARALAPADLSLMVDVAEELGLEVLVECHDEAELERAISLGAVLIGINNRNLETLELDLTLMERLVPLIPGDRIAIAESGIRSRDSVAAAAVCGADAVLVGSFVSAADDAESAVRTLTGVEKRVRGA